jgi:WD40 repeat protein/serine/threonine protein kinase
MLTSCLPAEKLRAFLADELPPDEESGLAEHVEACPHCQGLALALSDDGQTRQLLAEHLRSEGAARRRADEPRLEDVRERLHVLGWIGGLAADGGSTVAAEGLHRPGGGERTAADPIPEAAVVCVGKFQIIQPIGAGGFGVVYLARDLVLHRQVALKLARTSVLADPDLKGRFLREAEALARLSHPHIVPVYEAGEQDGTCFLAVGYCDGPTLEQWLREQGGSIDARLAARLVLALAEAVEHAHANGILHRDVKPSNILLAAAPPQAELPLIPKLTDFGLAKIAEQQSQTTVSGTLLGTPQYMAPEQAAGMLERIGPATDVYSLGAVLYELLTGQPPIRGSTPIDTLRRVLIDEPVRPRLLVMAVAEDLEAIVLKCLDKSPTKRYAAASELAADLARFLDGRPTLARPLSSIQRALRWVGRHRTASAVAGLVLLVLLLAGGMYLNSRRLANLQQEVVRASAEAAYRDDIVAAAEHFAAGDVTAAVPLLQRHLPQPGRPDLRSFEWHYLWAQLTHEAYAQYDAKTPVYQVHVSPSGQQLALACQDSTVRLLDARTLVELLVLPAEQVETNGVGWSSDGSRLAAAGDDGTIRIFDVHARREQRKIAAHRARAYAVAFVVGDRQLVSCGEEPVVRLWDAATGQPLATLEGHTRAVEALAVSPDGSLLATAASDGQAILWDLAGRKSLGVLAGHASRLTSVAFSTDGRLLATGGLDGAVCLWSVDRRERLGRAFSLDGVQSVAFTEADQRLVIADRGGAIRCFRLAPQADSQAIDLVLESAADAWQGQHGKVWSLAALPGGQQFVSAGVDGQVRAWSRGQQVVRRWDVQPDQLQSSGYNLDGACLFTLRKQHGVQVYDAATLQPLFSCSEEGLRWGTLAVLPGREQVAAGTDRGELLVWNWKSRNLIHRWQIVDNQWIDDLVYSPAAHLFAVISFSREDVLLIDANTGEQRAALPAPSATTAAFSPDGRRLVVDTLNKLAIYDCQTHELVHTAAGHTETVVSLAYSPDGGLIASASDDRSLRLWTSEGQPVATLHGHRAPVTAVAFTPDGRSLVSADEEGWIRVLHLATRRELLEIPSGLTGVRRLAIAPSSQRVVVIGRDRDIAVIGPAPRNSVE